MVCDSYIHFKVTYTDSKKYLNVSTMLAIYLIPLEFDYVTFQKYSVKY